MTRCDEHLLKGIGGRRRTPQALFLILEDLCPPHRGGISHPHGLPLMFNNSAERMCPVVWNRRNRCHDLRNSFSARVAALAIVLVGASGIAAATATKANRGPVGVQLNARSTTIADSTAMSAPARRSRRRLAGDDGGMGGAGAVEIEDCKNSEYSGTIGLGTPVQDFQVVFDTGSYPLWVTGVACEEDCSTTNKYDSSLSTTYIEDGTVFRQAYEDGTKATGILSVDALSVGGISAMATFGEMTTRALTGCDTVDGIMGMGLSSSSDTQSIFEDFVNSGVVEVPIFSFFMGDVDSESPTGVLTLGGVNQTHYEDCLEWLTTAEDGVPDGYWSMVLQNIKLGAESVLMRPAPSILDTGTSMIVGPFEDVGLIAETIGAECVVFTDPSSTSVYDVDCRLDAHKVELIMLECKAEFDDISFSFGGEDFTLTAKELLIPVTDFGPAATSTESDPLCLFGMMGHDERMWILGDPFLRAFYTAYNVHDRTVGLARATAERTSETCAADASISAVAADKNGEATEDSTLVPTPSTIAPIDAGNTSPPLATPVPSTNTASGEVAPVEGGAPPTLAPRDTVAGNDDSQDGSDAQTGNNEPQQQQEEEAEEDHGDEEALGSGGSSGGDDESEPSLAAVAGAASLGTLLIIALCGGTIVLVRRRIRKGHHHHTKLGGLGQGGDGLEMQGSGGAGGAGGANGMMTEAEDDFLQAGPGGYRTSGSGSHRYRVAAESGTTGHSGSNRVTVLGTSREEEDEEDDDEVEVDFGVSRPVGAGTPMGALGRMIGRGRAGFAAFDDRQELVNDDANASSRA